MNADFRMASHALRRGSRCCQLPRSFESPSWRRPLIDSGPNHAPSAERSAECGQVLALCAVFLVVLMGMAAAAIDVGSWYLARRQVQRIVRRAVGLDNVVAQSTLAALHTQRSPKTGNSDSLSGSLRYSANSQPTSSLICSTDIARPLISARSRRTISE